MAPDASLMNLLVAVKRAGQTTKSLQGEKPWTNLLETLEVSHQDQVWVSDITYVSGRFRRNVYAHRMFSPDDQSVAAQSALDTISDAQASQRSLMPQRP